MDANTLFFPKTNAYPRSGGIPTLAQGGTMTMPFIQQNSTGDAVAGDAHERAREIGMSGNPIPWMVAVLVVLIILRFVTEKYDSSAEYANFKISAYSIFTVTMAVIIGVPLMKLFATKFPIPGFTTLVMAV